MRQSTILCKRIKKAIKNPYELCVFILRWGLSPLIKDDETYIKWEYYFNFHKYPDLKKPTTFNEKINWLKLHDRQPIYTTMVDKYAVKDYVAKIIGEEYIIPTLGVWDSFEKINFEQLPNQFVLKCTHDSGGLVVCRDKSSFDYASARKKIKKSLKTNYYYLEREWPYKDVPPRIIAEKYMENDESQGDSICKSLIDYKFYCFNGKPEYVYVSTGLEDHSKAMRCFLTLNWEPAHFGRINYKPFIKLPEKPTLFEHMKTVASTLSKGHKFLRVDLYQINGRIYFSELTFSPCGGMTPFDPVEWDTKLGQLIVL